MGRYLRLSEYLKERFGGRVQRVTLEGGFTCPNRDGTKASGGCTFCTDDGSSSGARDITDSIHDQLLHGIANQGKRFGIDKFIAYFQSFTNTYAPVDDLRKLYDQGVDHPSIKVLAIGTRPDCVPEEVIDLFEEYTARGLEVWIDIGVQTSHDRTQELINRAHTYDDFLDACERINRRNNPLLRICTHVILGLPGETKEMMLETADRLSQTPIDDLKIHQLCILKGTAMEIDYLNGELQTLEEQEHIELVAEFIARMPKNVIIQRTMAEAKDDDLVAPMWADRGKKQGFLKRLDEYLEQHDVQQGMKYKKIAV